MRELNKIAARCADCVYCAQNETSKEYWCLRYPRHKYLKSIDGSVCGEHPHFMKDWRHEYITSVT